MDGEEKDETREEARACKAEGGRKQRFIGISLSQLR
jgi:hypothetical protein